MVSIGGDDSTLADLNSIFVQLLKIRVEFKTPLTILTVFLLVNISAGRVIRFIVSFYVRANV